MAFSDDAKALAHTLQSLYGDLGDLPLLKETPAQRQKNDGAPSRSLADYAKEIQFCKKCVLHIGRSKLVFGRGSPQARVAFVGDYPSTKDDAAGEPFSDEAGELLHKMIVAMKLKPEETYLTNLFKCRPPQNQVIDQDLAHICGAHLENQFEFLSATHIVAMGEHSAKALARSESPLNVLRNQTYEWNGRKVYCTYHPRELINSPAMKKLAWDDLQRVMRELK